MDRTSGWVVGRRELRAMVVGVLLYATLSWLTNIFPLATGVGVDIRPGVAVPIFFGFAFGPVAGFVTGTLGNFIGDLASGYIAYPPNPTSGKLLTDVLRGFQVNWEIGNGFIGLVPGLAALVYRRYFSVRDQLRAILIALIGIAIGIGFAALTDILIDPGMTLQKTLGESFVPATGVDVANAVILVPILLFNYARLDLRSVNWLRSGLMRRLCVAILISAALPVALLGLFLTQQATGSHLGAADLTFRLGLTVLATLMLAVANAALVGASISRPLLRLTRAAELMEAGQYSKTQASELKTVETSDEIGTLSRLFGRMAEEVIQREESLRRQVQELRIEIDHSKKAREVAEITGTEYFESLQRKARELRSRSNLTSGTPV